MRERLWILGKMAARNLLRNRRRTFLTLTTIALGLAVAVWLEGILAARSRDMIETVTRGYIGHLQLYKQGYLADRSLGATFDEVPADITQALPTGAHVARRVLVPALVLAGSRARQVTVVGIVPAEARATTDIAEKLGRGAFLSPTPDPGTPEIYIGRALADDLKVADGDTLNLVAQDANGKLQRLSVHIVGSFDAGSRDFERQVAFTHIETARALGAIRGLHEAIITLPTGATAELWRTQLRTRVPDSLELTTWREALPEVATLVTFNDATVAFVTGLLMAIVLLSVVNILLISVSERIGEFGVMTALGTTPREVLAVVVIESALIGICACLLGLALGIAAISYHRVTGFDLQPFLGRHSNAGQFALQLIVYPIFLWGPFLRGALICFLATVVAGAWPAWVAARLAPAVAMRRG